jgi:hypothetical protein
VDTYYLLKTPLGVFCILTIFNQFVEFRYFTVERNEWIERMNVVLNDNNSIDKTTSLGLSSPENDAESEGFVLLTASSKHYSSRNFK